MIKQITKSIVLGKVFMLIVLIIDYVNSVLMVYSHKKLL